MDGTNQKQEWYGFKLCGQPKADECSVIQGGKYRITVLTDRMIRLEYNEEGVFLDKATRTVINRAFPKADFRVSETPDKLRINTEHLRLTYDKRAFSPGGLTIEVIGAITAWDNMWWYGQQFKTLGGTARTLDEADGAIPLEDGLVSANGYAVIDDSASMIIEADGWVSPRASGSIDLYFLGYGRDYLGCLKDFFKLTGQAPLIPRWALGNWWSRFHRYTDEEYIALMERFKAEDIPFSVAVIDIDWHATQIDKKYGSGWTGYTWNTELFPDYKAFLKRLRDMNLAVTLNLHPADGVRAHEAMYLSMAKELGVDYENEDKIEFDAADARFLEACFKHIFHPYEKDGVDFWWIDWQQQGGTSVQGIDPLWVLNHFHYMDNCRNGKRGMTFSRYAGLGSHRYPVGFSGDSFATWESLDFQPYFTATASNAGYGWWSHDIGGHMHGCKDDEMAARWVQLGVFSPINRLHSTVSPFNQKEPWMFGMVAEAVMKRFLRLRHALVPYVYTLNRQYSRQGLPPVQPIYYKHPFAHDAYNVPNQFFFGSELMVCPITKPADRRTGLGAFDAWLPEGIYIDIFCGRVYHGGRRLTLYRGLETLPVLAAAGGVIPLAAGESANSVWNNPSEMEILFAAGNGSFAMYEDNEQTGGSADTYFTIEDSGGSSLCIRVTPKADADGVIPLNRVYTITVLGITDCSLLSVTIGDERIDSSNAVKVRDAARKALSLKLPVSGTLPVIIELMGITRTVNDIVSDTFNMLHKAQIEYDLKVRVYDLVRNNTDKGRILGELLSYGLDAALLGALTEIITAS